MLDIKIFIVLVDLNYRIITPLILTEASGGAEGAEGKPQAGKSRLQPA